jgi:CHAT domain-containing protein
VVSLWPVNDGVTVVLMKAFYDQLKAGAPPPRALREAQRRVRALSRAELAELARGLRDLAASEAPPELDATHPLFWAPFIVVGVWPGEQA